MSKIELWVKQSKKYPTTTSVVLNEYRVGGVKWNDIDNSNVIITNVDKNDVLVALGVDNQIAELKQQLDELKIRYDNCNKEKYEESLRLQQFYSRLGVEAYGENIQEQAIKELDKLKEKESKKIKKLKKELEETNELLEMANEDRAFKGEMWEGFKDKCKILTTKLHTQPKEIVEKIRYFIKENFEPLEGRLGCEGVIDREEFADLLDEILKEYGGERWLVSSK